MADRQKKQGKSSPKIKRAGRANTKAKYAAQVRRTFRNKLRRVRKHNGPAAAKAYVEKYA